METKFDFWGSKKVSSELKEVIMNLCNDDNRYAEILNNLSGVFDLHIETPVIVQIVQNIMHDRNRKMI